MTQLVLRRLTQRLKVTAQPVGLELAQEQLLSERQERQERQERKARKARPERRILDGMVLKLERHSSASSEHRLEHTPPEHNTKAPFAHKPEHMPQLEQHSWVSRYSNWPPERHTMASSSTDQASAY